MKNRLPSKAIAASPLSYVGTVAIILLLASGFATQASALELNRQFSNDMVLQRDKPLLIQGAAAKGAAVTVAFADQTQSTTADQNGRWSVTLQPVAAKASPQTLTVTSGDSAIKLKNILVGDVFVFARQSSIDVALGTTPAGRDAAAALVVNPNYRFIRITTSPSRTPLANLKPEATNGWQTVDKRSALTMSAAAFHLGHELATEVDVPIGIVDLDMGYHFPIAWLSDKGLQVAKSMPGPGTANVKRVCENLPKDIAAWDRGEEPVPHHGKKKPNRPGALPGLSPIEFPHMPSVCYNAVVHPLRGLAAKGMLLQLGNDYPWVLFKRLRKLGKLADQEEVSKANQQSYKVLGGGHRMTPQVLPTAVDDLRRSLGDASLPLAWIMPPGSDKYNYAIHNRDVREVQRRAQAKGTAIDLVLPGAGYVRMSGQPADETLLANRCKQWALSTFYEAKGSASGPLFDRLQFQGGTATIFFKPGTASGLSAKGDALAQFEAAAKDGDFFPCSARLEGETIKLTCKDIPEITKVRYGWQNYPPQGLVNGADLPAPPFNTDPQWQFNAWPNLAPPAPLEVNTANAVISNPQKNPEKFDQETWENEREMLVTLVKDGGKGGHGGNPRNLYPEDQWNRWRRMTIETASHAPDGWQKPGFDDSSWDEVTLPSSWAPNHLVLLRTEFEVEDIDAFQWLRLRTSNYKLVHFDVYLNGYLVSRVNIRARVFHTEVTLEPQAMELLKQGENTLAVIAHHGRRHVDFSLILEGRLKNH